MQEELYKSYRTCRNLTEEQKREANIRNCHLGKLTLGEWEEAKRKFRSDWKLFLVNNKGKFFCWHDNTTSSRDVLNCPTSRIVAKIEFLNGTKKTKIISQCSTLAIGWLECPEDIWVYQCCKCGKVYTRYDGMD